MKIRPIGTVRNESTYKVSDGKAEYTVVHSTTPAICEETIYCVSCGVLRCDHADAVRLALAAVQ